MANLEGNLSSSSIDRVLQTLVKKNPASTWLISDGESEKVVYFSTGGVRLYASPQRRVGEVERHLLAHGAITEEQLETARIEFENGRGADLAEVLERMELIPRERFLDAVAALIFFELCDLVTWENAIFEFYEGNPPPEIFDRDHPALFAGLDVKELAARVQEWNVEWGKLRSRLYSERLCPSRLIDDDALASVPSFGVVEQHVYRLVDGKRTLRELALASGYDFPLIARLVHAGMESGMLTGTLVPVKNASTEEEVLSEVERLEEALERAINTILIHKRIATSYEKIEQNDRASAHYESIGNIHTAGGRIARAVESYRRAIKLSPENIGAHEKLIRRLQDSGDDTRALDEILELGKKLVAFGFLERAYDTLRGVVSKVPQRFDIRILFADVLLKLGRVQEAIAAYLGIARDRKLAGAVENLDELYLKVLALDPVNKEARAGLTGERRRRVGRKVVWTNALTAAAAVLLLAGWGYVEVTSRTAWGAVRGEIERAVEARDVENGFAAFRRYLRRHPGSRFVPELAGFEEELFRDAFAKLEEDLLEAWKKVRRRAVKLVEARRFEKGFFVCREIIRHYPEGARGLRVPFLIRSRPSGASVSIDGIPKGLTPAWITVRYGRGQQVLVEKYGYPRKKLGRFEDRSVPIINVDLEQ